MAAAFRSGLSITPDDRLNRLRQAERSAWFAFLAACEAVALIPLNAGRRLDQARLHVIATRSVWREAYSALDATTMRMAA